MGHLLILVNPFTPGDCAHPPGICHLVGPGVGYLLILVNPFAPGDCAHPPGICHLVGPGVGYLPILVNPFAPGDFAEKHVFKLVEWFSGHCQAIKS